MEEIKLKQNSIENDDMAEWFGLWDEIEPEETNDVIEPLIMVQDTSANEKIGEIYDKMNEIIEYINKMNK